MEPIPLSAVASFVFCPRQAYLAQAEGLRAPNAALIDGASLHRRKEQQPIAGLPTTALRWGSRLAHSAYGLVGQADVIAFLDEGPLPIERKRGQRHGEPAHAGQLALQALCLEEATGHPVPNGWILQGEADDIEPITINDTLHNTDLSAPADLRAALKQPTAPLAHLRPAYAGCSLRGHCLPTLPTAAPNQLLP
jgi:CRISPR-associated exonuclease Cas4